jgi:hypothetical protein
VTDLEQFKAMLGRAGIPFEEHSVLGETVILLEARGIRNTLQGYDWLRPELAFGWDGSLTDVGIRE